MFEGRAAIGYDHGYDAQKFYLGLALDPKYVEGCLERIGEAEPEDEDLFRTSGRMSASEVDDPHDIAGGMQNLAQQIGTVFPRIGV